MYTTVKFRLVVHATGIKMMSWYISNDVIILYTYACTHCVFFFAEGRELLIDTCKLHSIRRTLPYSRHSELGNQISTRGAPSLNCKTLYLSSACTRVVSITLIAALWKHTKSQRGNTSEWKERSPYRSTWRWQLSCNLHVPTTLAVVISWLSFVSYQYQI